MNKKSIIATFTLVFIAGITIWAMSANKPAEQQSNTVKVEQVSTENPAHCDPSNCTPEEAAKCPYSNKAQMSATADAKSENVCPETKDCPPSKCNTSAKSEKETL